jgi:protocatechuate 3,4-dioxygenase beta subunit
MVRSLVIASFCLVIPAAAPGQTDAPKEAQRQSVQGKVVEAKSGQPIRKVKVDLAGGSVQSYGSYSATTQADGTFIIEDVKPGRYSVMLERAGFVQTGTRVATLTLLPGQSVSGLAFKLQAGGVISGKIMDADGDPIVGVSVNAEATGKVARGADRYRPTSGTTNDLGEYRIADLRPGKYLISAVPGQRPGTVEENGKEKGRLIYSRTYFPGTVDESQGVEIQVHGGDEVVANFGLLMARAYRVSGAVAGVPSADMVQILLTSKNGGAQVDSPTQLREGNRFEYGDVLPGSYVAMMMVVKLSGGKPEMQMVRLTPSIGVDKDNVEGVQLRAEPGGRIHGTFRLDTGGKFDWTELIVNLLPIAENPSEPLSGNAIGVTAYSGANPIVSSDGSFELKNVPSGTYQLLVGDHSDNLRDYYTKSVILGGRDVVDSGFGMNGDLYLDVVVSAKGATIDGNVLDSTGQAVAYGMVAVVPNLERRARPDSYQLEQTDEHGHFLARGLNPGNYVVLAFEELREDVRQPDFLKVYGEKGEKVEVGEGMKKSVTLKIIPAE